MDQSTPIEKNIEGTNNTPNIQSSGYKRNRH